MKAGRESFPSLSQAALLLLASFLLQYVFGALLYDLRHAIDLTEDQSQPLVMVLAYGVVLVSVMHHRGMTYRDLVHPTNSSVLATLMLLTPPVLLLVPIVLLLDQTAMDLLRPLLPTSAWEEQAFARMTASNLPAVIATCVLAPILEEMLFRGILLRAFLAQCPRWAAIAYSALLFGAAHLNVYQFVLAFALGLVLGWLYDRSRSLLPCMVLHAGLNTAVVMLETAVERGHESSRTGAGAVAWLVALLAAMVATYLLRRTLVSPKRAAAALVER